MISRQKIVGWVLVIVSSLYLAYYIKVRLLMPGPILERKEWFNLIVSVITLMIGTANVRLAAMRDQNRRPGSD